MLHAARDAWPLHVAALRSHTLYTTLGLGKHAPVSIMTGALCVHGSKCKSTPKWDPIGFDPQPCPQFAWPCPRWPQEFRIVGADADCKEGRCFQCKAVPRSFLLVVGSYITSPELVPLFLVFLFLGFPLFSTNQAFIFFAGVLIPAKILKLKHD